MLLDKFFNKSTSLAIGQRVQMETKDQMTKSHATSLGNNSLNPDVDITEGRTNQPMTATDRRPFKIRDVYLKK